MDIPGPLYSYKARKKDLHATNYEAKGVSKETDIYKEDGLCGKS